MNDNRVLKCEFKERVYKRYKHALDSTTFRQDQVVNSDKGGRRHGDGTRGSAKSMSRRGSSKKAKEGEDTCKFRIVIKWDKYGFYLHQAAGCPYHNGHPEYGHQDLALPTRLVPEVERQMMVDLHNINAGAGVGRNYLLQRLGQFLPMTSIRYIQDPSLPQLEPGDPRRLPANDVEGLLKFFEEAKDISYLVLWDVPTVDDTNTHVLVSTRYVGEVFFDYVFGF